MGNIVVLEFDTIPNTDIEQEKVLYQKSKVLYCLRFTIYIKLTYYPILKSLCEGSLLLIREISEADSSNFTISLGGRQYQ